MDSRKILLCFIVSLSCLTLHTDAAQASLLRKRTPQVALLNLCKSSTKPSLCVKTILPKIDVRVPFNHYKALEIAILAAKNHTIKTSEHISTLILNPTTPKNIAGDLDLCKELYVNMLDSLETSLSVVKSGNAVEASYKFNGYTASRATCEDGFSGKISPIESDLKLSFDLGSVVLDIMAAIKERALKRVARRFGSLLPPPTSVTLKPSDPCFGVIGTCSH
ncbi:hypothetical protein HN51_004071 [Arachis hypogaea]|nr:Pectinesterase inhibitor [Arachis hypogaea]